MTSLPPPINWSPQSPLSPSPLSRALARSNSFSQFGHWIHSLLARFCDHHFSLACFLLTFGAWRILILIALGTRGPFSPSFPELRVLFVTTFLALPVWALFMCFVKLDRHYGRLFHDHRRGWCHGDAEYRAVALDLDGALDDGDETDEADLWGSRSFLIYLSLILFGLIMLCTAKSGMDYRFKRAVNQANLLLKKEGYGSGEKIFIAAMFHDNAHVVPYWETEIEKLINYVGPNNVFVSIIESYSTDSTPELLRAFDAKLEAAGIPRRIITQDTSIPRPESMHTAPPRIDFLAATRNLAIAPLTSGAAGVYDRLLFSNDVFIEAEAIVELLNTKDGEYDVACGMDFYRWGLYDTWVLRDRLGRLVSTLYPYFLEDAGFRAVMADEPAPVFTCWNGIISINADPFLPPSLRQGKLSSRPLGHQLPATHPWFPRPANMTPADEPVIQFRGSFLPPSWNATLDSSHRGASYPAFDSDSAPPYECFSSESFLLPYDLRRVYGLHRFYANPRVVNAYKWRYYIWAKYVLRHWLVRFWIEWVENGSWMHLTKYVIGDPTEVWEWDGGDCHPGPWW